jgi:protocatechuate 3,4-dioxygenase beta subunit
MIRLLTSTALLAGCLSVPRQQKPACTSNDDCGTGEVCDVGVCYGNPPTGVFAAALGPPSNRSDLVPTEIPTFSIPHDGWLGDLQIDEPVTFSGRIQAFCVAPAACSDTSVPATITVTRASTFLGGPGFHAVVDAQQGIAAGNTSFTLALPTSHDGDPDYLVTITPDGRGAAPPNNGSTSPAELAPPFHEHLRAVGDLPAMTITLGAADSPVITGTITDAGNHPLASYRVVALGRWEAGAAATEVSTVDYTGTTGSYSITLASGIVGNVEIVATPYDANVVLPELHLPNIPPVSGPRALVAPSGLGSPTHERITIVGVSGSGEIAPVAGARVVVRSSYAPSVTGSTHAELGAEVTTDSDGNANLTLLDGQSFVGGYTVTVTPPISSTLGVVYNQQWTFDQTESVCAMSTQPCPVGTTCSCIGLPPRIAVRGTLKDTQGNPIANASVTATPSLRFTWSLAPGDQDFLTQIPAATATTPDSGDFVVWVDPYLAGVWGHYDLSIEPASGADTPLWTVADIEIPRAGQSALTLGDVVVPDAANIHGRITDPSGNPVEGGELRVFSIATDTSLCSQVTYHPDACVIPAQLTGHGTSDSLGVVRLTLPRP